MAKQYSVTSDEVRDRAVVPEAASNFIGIPTVVASPYQVSAEAESVPGTRPACVLLSLEDLKCFEVVERQYQYWDVTFRNAIALHPSNPAYPPHSGTIVLMGAPKNGFLEAMFEHPVRFVSGYVTSSQRTILSAYDKDDKLLARSEMSGQNLVGTESEIPPNHQLTVNVPNICRITFYSFDGQLTVDDLSFGF